MWVKETERNAKENEKPQYYWGFSLFSLARPERFELPAKSLEGSCSVQLSYGRVRARYTRLCIFFKIQAAHICRQYRVYDMATHAPAIHVIYPANGHSAW